MEDAADNRLAPPGCPIGGSLATGPVGFTLLELLVTISILALLMTMLMPIMSLANREARKTGTRSVIAKADTALRLFRAEIGLFPYQRTYEDFTTSTALSTPASFALVNRLYYHLGTDIADADRVKVEQDATDAADAYWPHSTTTRPYNGTPSTVNAAKPHAYAQSDFTISGDSVMPRTMTTMANRLAKERVRRAVFAGHTGVTGGRMSQYTTDKNGVRTAKPRQLPTTALLASPDSEDKPGWATDYLRGEIPARQRSGEALLDGWGRPLIYVCQAIEGMAEPVQIKMMAGYNSTFFSAADAGLGPIGRTTLAAADSGVTCLELAGYPFSALPDAADLRRSDRRYYAPSRLELEYELWSAGPDGRFRWLRRGADADGVDAGTWNGDNVALTDYDRSLP
jgi:prepilin-type N-terminal cleavage/methylation domain-containing protein